jgi:WD40 repeat protein
MILGVAVADSHQMAALGDGMELALRIVNRLRAYYDYFKCLPADQTKDNLRSALVDLYAHVLGFLAQAIKLYSMRASLRVIHAVWNQSAIAAFAESSMEFEQRTEIEANLCDRKLSAMQEEQAAEWKSRLEYRLSALGSGIKGIETSLSEIQISAALSELRQDREATFNSAAQRRLGTCLSDTRVDLLAQIAQWADDADGKAILCLQGMAGTGKSTIARSFAESLEDKAQEKPGASFFFKRSRNDRSNSRLLIPTLAAQLAKRIPFMKLSIANAIRDDSGLCDQGIRDQFSKLLVQPMTAAPSAQMPANGVFLIIDDVDEWERDEFVQFLKLVKGLDRYVRLRVFLTNRPGTSVEAGFAHIDQSVYHKIVLEDAQATTIESDIRKYLNHKFAEIRDVRSQDLSREPLPASWAAAPDVEVLVRAAGPFFGFASTLCRYVAEESSQHRLDAVLAPDRTVSSLHIRDKLPHLRTIYADILQRIVADHDEAAANKKAAKFRKVVGILVVSFEALSRSQLAHILDTNLDEIDDVLDNLKSVIRVPEDPNEPVKIFHSSFREFLLDENNKAFQHFRINEAQAHALLGEDCIRLMCKPGELRRDMMDLRNPGISRSAVEGKIRARILPWLSYACHYFHCHIASGNAGFGDGIMIHQFLKAHILHWIETLVWCDGKMDWALNALDKIIDQARNIVHPQNNDLITLSQDAEAFCTVCNWANVSLHPLQLYQRSQLLPTENTLKLQYLQESLSLWRHSSAPPMSSWRQQSPLRFMMRDRDYYNKKVKMLLSPDACVIACNVFAGVQLRNIESGVLLHTLQWEEQRIGCRAMAFSPDSRILATTCQHPGLPMADGQTGGVQLWNASTGKMEQMIGDLSAVGEGTLITSVAFSADGQIIALGTEVGTATFWNARDGRLMSTYAFEGKRAIQAMAFSPDGRLLACTFDTRLSNASSLEPSLRPPRFNDAHAFEDWIKRVQDPDVSESISLKPPRFKSLAEYQKWSATLRMPGETHVIDVRLHQRLQTFKMECSVQKLRQPLVTFSPDGQQIIIAIDSVKRFDLRTGALLQTIFDDRPKQLAFSADGQCIRTEGGSYFIDTDPSLGLRRLPRGPDDLHVLNGNVIYSGKEVLDIEKDLETGNAMVFGETLVMGDWVGGVGFFRLQPDAISWRGAEKI